MVGLVRTPDKFRFTLQWNADTDEKVRAGDFLESLGNRKSELIVLALTEYIAAHPEMMSVGRKLKIEVKQNITADQVKVMVLAMIEEKLAGITTVERGAGASVGELMVSETEIDEMLNNLDLFSS